MKDILVSLDSINSSKNCIDAAVLLAEMFDSHITCLYEEKVHNGASYTECYADIIITHFEKQLERDRDSISQIYNECVKSREAKCTLEFEKPSGPNNVFSYANVSDLVMCAQHEPDRMAFGDNNVPENLILDAGKPVLIIPYIGIPETIGKNIIVAWDYSREASRAIHDALPLLKQAQQVHIFSAMSNKREEQKMTATTDLVAHLQRHKINADNVPMVLENVPAGEILLSRASDYGADLIVMGAYGHSRLREYTLGGTTRTILDSMTVPVLMTH